MGTIAQISFKSLEVYHNTVLNGMLEYQPECIPAFFVQAI